MRASLRTAHSSWRAAPRWLACWQSGRGAQSWSCFPHPARRRRLVRRPQPTGVAAAMQQPLHPRWQVGTCNWAGAVWQNPWPPLQAVCCFAPDATLLPYAGHAAPEWAASPTAFSVFLQHLYSSVRQGCSLASEQQVRSEGSGVAGAWHVQAMCMACRSGTTVPHTPTRCTTQGLIQN